MVGLKQFKHAGRIVAKGVAITDYRCEGGSSMIKGTVFLAMLVAATLPRDKEHQTSKANAAKTIF